MAKPSQTYGKTPEQLDALLQEAARLLQAGGTWDKIAADLGVGANWLKRRLLPGFREKDNEESRRRLYGEER